jgi:hypothetical protein
MGQFMLIHELMEMAKPLESHREIVYYHGTSSEEAGISILKNGIEPGNVVMPNRSPSKKPNLVPVSGKVYITPDIGYAQIYALGGDVAGSKSMALRWKERIGYLFIISGKDLVDIQPDEDSIGEMIFKLATEKQFENKLQWLYVLARRKLTDKQWAQLIGGEYVMFAHAGKKLLPLMTDEQKLQLISLGAHVAHTGKLIPSAAYKIDGHKIGELRRDGSNFFDVAEKVR